MPSTPRLATLRDRSAVDDVVQRAYAHYVSRIGRPPGPMLDDYGVLIDAGRVHLIEQSGAVRAIIVLIPEPTALLLDNVAVAPEAQGLGLGRALMSFAERSAVTAGYRRIRLYTNEAMTENIALYLRLGYVETHRAEEQGLKRVYMVKTLAGAAGN